MVPFRGAECNESGEKIREGGDQACLDTASKPDFFHLEIILYPPSWKGVLFPRVL